MIHREVIAKAIPALSRSSFEESISSRALKAIDSFDVSTPGSVVVNSLVYLPTAQVCDSDGPVLGCADQMPSIILEPSLLH